jgi:hypothetical protein
VGSTFAVNYAVAAAAAASSLENVVLLELSLEQRDIPGHPVLQRSYILAAVQLVGPAHRPAAKHNMFTIPNCRSKSREV